MSKLVSIHSKEGLSKEDAKKVITISHPRARKGPSNELELHRLATEEPVKSDSVPTKRPTREIEDVQMIGSDTFEQVESIAHLALLERQVDYDYNQMDSIMEAEDLLANLTYIPTLAPTGAITFLVVDTNFILSHLDILDELVKSHNLYNQCYQLVLPRTTIQELDGLKNSTRRDTIVSNHSISQLLRWANDWCYEKLANSNLLVRGQRLDEKLDLSTRKDDSILDCCLYFQKLDDVEHLVVLMSNDKNFCMKLLTNGILTVSYRPGMTAKLIAEMIVRENLHRNGATPIVDDEASTLMEIETDHNLDDGGSKKPVKSSYLITVDDVPSLSKLIFQEIELLLRSLVDTTLKDIYGDDLELMDYDAPESMRDLFNLILRYWISSFSDCIRCVNFKYEFDNSNARRKKTSSDKSLYIEIPDSMPQLRKFVSFWVPVLKDLYATKSQRDNEALDLFIERWNNVIDQLS